MKKIFTLIAAAAIAAAASAADYSHLVLRLTDGSETTVKASGTRFNIADGQLTVSHADGSSVFALTDLASMAFINDPASIEAIETSDCTEVDVYTTAGIHVGRYASPTEARRAIDAAGVYIIKGKNATAKMLIRK